MNLHIFKLSVLGLFVLTGCNNKITDDGEVVACTEEFVSAININVFDKETGFPSSCGVTAILQDGDFIEELSNETSDNCNDDFIFSMAGEREGKYDITIIKEGYNDWVQYDTVVTSNICHVNAITIQVYLEK